MIYFKELFQKIISTIFINIDDSDELKAMKIIWYSTVGAVIILIIVSFIVLNISIIGTDIVKVPMIEGDNIYTALNKLYEKKLIPRAAVQYSETIDSQTVYNQNPNPGTIVKEGRVVTFIVSLGSKENSLPDFRGFNLFELEDYLNSHFKDKNKIGIEQVVYEYSDQVEKGRIIKQSPKDGVPIVTVKKIKFWVSNGPKQEGARTLKNYIGKNITEVSQELSDIEVLYAYDYELVNKNDQDMIIIDQGVNEGKLIDELVQEQKIVFFKVNKYFEKNKDKIKGTYVLDIPKKPLPFTVEVKIQTGSSKEKSLKKLSTKGGVSIPIPYSAKENSRLMIFYEGKLANTVELIEESKVQ